MFFITKLKKKKFKKSCYKAGLSVMKKQPQRKAICAAAPTHLSPRKPNSARRKVIKIGFFQWRERMVFTHIPGETTHGLDRGSVVLIRGGRTQDVPGLKTKIIRGQHSAKPVLWRITSRSKYGVKRWKTKKIKVI